MNLKVFNGSEKEPEVMLSLREIESGVYVSIVDENGNTLNNLCRFMENWTLRLMTSVSERFGFKLDEEGKIVLD